MGTGAGGGVSTGVQLAIATAAAAAAARTTPLHRASRRPGRPASAAVVAKLELDAEILAPEHRDDRLELVAGGARHPDLVALDRRLGLLEAAVLDRLDDLLRY